MKRLFLLTVFFGPFLTQAQPGAFTLNGKVGNLSAPAKAYLRYGTGPAVTMDSVQIQNGTFSFKGAVTDPQRATLFVDKVAPDSAVDAPLRLQICIWNPALLPSLVPIRSITPW